LKVFVSWSGERSQALAKAIHEWLPMILHFAEPWVSQSDIEPGERWANEVGKELEASKYGIICITKENLVSPWILFEAGALAKSMEQGRVIPLLLGIEFKDVAGPLAQFQAKKVEKSGVFEIVASINKLEPQRVPEARLAQLFDLLWPQLEKKIAEIPVPTGQVKPNRPQQEILEELVTGVRGLDSRFRDSLESDPRGRKRRRFHPEMMMEMQHVLDLRPGDPLSILVFASLFKDDVPWLYELGLEAYRSASSGHAAKARRSLQKFASAIRALRRGPFIEMFGGDKNTYYLMRDVERFLEFLPPELFDSSLDEPDEDAASASEKI
jgi:hypothetical protein